MAINYKMAGENNRLVVTATGFDEDLKEVELYGAAIIKACVEGNYSQVLCNELDLEYRLSTLDTFKSAEFLALQAPRIGKAAIVCNEKFISDALFWETVAVNRGLEVRVFKDMKMARIWLGKK